MLIPLPAYQNDKSFGRQRKTASYGATHFYYSLICNNQGIKITRYRRKQNIIENWKKKKKTIERNTQEIQIKELLETDFAITIFNMVKET